MYGRSSSDRSIVDKMMRLFIVQAISGFVARDFDTGIHFLNEVKTHFAQNQSQLNPVLKGLAKEIIQSLDLLQPGASADMFSESNATIPMTPQSELSNIISKKNEPIHDDVANPAIAEVLKRRKMRKSGHSFDEIDNEDEPPSLEEELDLGELPFEEESLPRRKRKRSDLWDEL